MTKITRVALLTNTIGRPGGAEYVTLAMFNSLRDLDGVVVGVLGRERRIDLNKLNEWLPLDLAQAVANNYKYVPGPPLGLLKLKGYDLVINTRSNEVLSPAHIHYLHWIFSPYGAKDPEVIAYYRNAYGTSGSQFLRHVLHYIQLKVTRLVLTNSSYVSDLLKNAGVNAKVLYPPVRSREIEQRTSGTTWDRREKLVVTVARIAPGKQLELIPSIASRVKGVEFILAGSLSDEKYYVRLLRLARILRAKNFGIMLNVPTPMLHELLGKATIYLHTAHHEQFGIAVVEGMAAGCIPVVHKSGGPYYDILGTRDGEYGFCYRNREEAASIIGNIVGNYRGHQEIHLRAKKRSLIFDENIFSSKMTALTRSLLAEKIDGT